MKEKTSRVYTPRIRDKTLINRLYALKQLRKKPMTFLLRDALCQYLDKEEMKDSDFSKENGPARPH